MAECGRWMLLSEPDYGLWAPETSRAESKLERDSPEEIVRSIWPHVYHRAWIKTSSPRAYTLAVWYNPTLLVCLPTTRPVLIGARVPENQAITEGLWLACV